MKEDKFDYVYTHCKDLVLDTAYEVLGDYYLAQDVCHDVFLKLMTQRIEQMRTYDELRCYLRTVAYHRAIDCYRKRVRHPDVMLEEGIEPPMEMNIESALDAKRFTNMLFRGLAEKNPEWHEIVIRLAVYDEFPEIVARDMGISVEALRIKYHRAKKWIRKNYKDEYEYLERSSLF